jgi:hypothetical protein
MLYMPCLGYTKDLCQPSIFVLLRPYDGQQSQ